MEHQKHREKTDGPLLEAFDLEFSYGKVRALNSLSLTFGPGIVGVLGPNGAGKSTLLHILAGAETAGTGQVRWRGEALNKEPVRKQYARRLGFLPQTFEFIPGFTVRDTVECIAWMRIGVGATVASAVDDALQSVGMLEHARRRIGALSGGQRRRVGIAQAIVNRPHVLLLDEPTAGLDPAQRVSFRRLLQGFASDSLIVVSTHLVEDVASICGDVKIMEGGSVQFEGSPHALAALGTEQHEGGSPLERGYHAVLGGAKW